MEEDEEYSDQNGEIIDHNDVEIDALGGGKDDDGLGDDGEQFEDEKYDDDEYDDEDS